MSNMNNAIQNSMNVYFKQCSKYGTEELKELLSKEESEILSKRDPNSWDDAFITNSLQDNRISVIKSIIKNKTTEYKNFENETTQVENCNITFVNENGEIFVIENKDLGINVIVDGWRIKGKGSKKHNDYICNVAKKVDKYVKDNRIIKH